MLIYRRLLTIWLFALTVVANTETFMLDLQNRKHHLDDINNQYESNYLISLIKSQPDKTYVYQLAQQQVDITNEYHLDISNLYNFNDSIYVFFDVSQLQSLSYFVRVCWSAIHPISIEFFDDYLSSDSGNLQYLIVKVATDYYTAEEHESRRVQLLNDFVLQVTLDTNNFILNTVSGRMVQLGVYIAAVTAFAVVFAMVLV